MSENQSTQEENYDFTINFADAKGFEPFVYEDRPDRSVVRPLSKDGYYETKIAEAKPKASSSKNGMLDLRLEVQDEDEVGAAVYTSVPCTGHSKTASKRPNIHSLIPVLLSTGRTMQDINERAERGDLMQASVMARALTQEGKNICYVQIKHEIQTNGKNAGKERATVKNFVPQSVYEARKARRGGIRWDKKLGNEAITGGNGVHMPEVDVSEIVPSLIG